jgi:hypothetical protein
MKPCNEIREFLLDCDWVEEDLQKASDAIDHLRGCPQCSAVVRDYLRINGAVRNDQPGIPEGGWSAMQRRLMQKVPPPTRFASPWLRTAAAILFAVVVGYGLGRGPASQPAIAMRQGIKTVQTRPDESTGFSQQDIAQHVKAFDEMSNIFERRAAWLLVDGNTSDMGVSASPIDKGQILLLRLTMLKSGTIVSSADLAIIPGQTASLNVPINQNAGLHYRISASDDQPTRLTISTQLTTAHETDVLAALATTLEIEPGRKLTAGNMVTNNGDYELQIDFGRAQLTAK